MFAWFSMEALEQPIILESLSVISACNQTANLLLLGASSGEVNESMNGMLQMRTQAMKSLRVFLQSGSTARAELTITIIGHLLCLEVSSHLFDKFELTYSFLYHQGAQGNAMALETHINGIKALVSVCGGIDNLSINTLSIIY